MTLFFIRLFDRSDPETFPSTPLSSSQRDAEQEVERRPRQVVEHLREVRVNYSLERHIFF
jgi:hypothetical protein